MATRKDEPAVFKRWDSYVEEADQPPFRLPVSDDHTIVISAPTGEQVFKASRSSDDPEEMLRVACGDAADEVLALVKGAPYKAMNALVTDIMRHFGFDLSQVPGESPASSS